MNNKYALLLFICSMIFARIDTRIDEAAYFRIEKMGDMPTSFNLTAAEVNLEGLMTRADQDLLRLAVQIYVWGTMEGWEKAMHYGNAYLVLPMGLGKPSFKIGQHVVPFGLLAEYDTHGQVIQNPYALALGERIDTGISAFGYLGALDWWYMVSNGCGPGLLDRDENKVQTLRVAMKRETSWVDLKMGISLLRGVLPSFSHDPFTHMAVEPDTFIMKNRIGFDLEISPVYFTLRGELVGGYQDELMNVGEITTDGIMSAYIEARVPVFYGLEMIGTYSRFSPVVSESGNTSEIGIGFGYTPKEISALNFQCFGIKNTMDGESDYRVVVQMGVDI